MTPDGSSAASASHDGVTYLELISTRSKVVFTGHDGHVFAVATSADGQRIASGGQDATVRVWDVPSRTCIGTLRGHRDAVYGVALSADGVTAVSTSTTEHCECGIYRLSHVSRRWEAAPEEFGVAITPNGKYAASASEMNVRVWDLASGLSAFMERSQWHVPSIHSGHNEGRPQNRYRKR